MIRSAVHELRKSIIIVYAIDVTLYEMSMTLRKLVSLKVRIEYSCTAPYVQNVCTKKSVNNSSNTRFNDSTCSGLCPSACLTACLLTSQCLSPLAYRAAGLRAKLSAWARLRFLFSRHSVVKAYDCHQEAGTLNSRNLRTIATIGLSRPVFVHKKHSIHLILLTHTLCTLHVVMLYCFRARAVISSLAKQTALHLGKQKCKQVREPSRSRFSSTSNELRSAIPPNQLTGIGMALQTLVQTD